MIPYKKTKTSTGNDGISVQLLKLIAPGIVKPLTAILNQSLKTGIFPNNLKLAKIIRLHKKESRELMDNYRPVSLLNALSTRCFRWLKAVPSAKGIHMAFQHLFHSIKQKSIDTCKFQNQTNVTLNLDDIFCALTKSKSVERDALK